MNEPITTLYDELKINLRILEEETISPIKRFSAKLEVISKSLDQLKQYLNTSPFKNKEEEINFFKNIKPLFVSEQIVAQQLFNIEVKRKEMNDQPAVRFYLEQELVYIKHYFSQHQFLYQYFQLEASELDNLLFIRGEEIPKVILPETPDLDANYSTKGDYLFAKFMAYERIAEILHGELFPSTEREKLKKSLKWTGDKMNLIELAYAINDTAQINNGDTDIKDIIDWLEDSLNINLSRYYRMFSEMKGRKLVSPTRYLDHAVNMLKEHLQKGEDFRPQVPQPVSGSKSTTKK
jgi:hypothetical protein